MCFMTIGESGEVRLPNSHNCNILESNLDMITDKLQKTIDEYNKLAQQKKSCEARFKQKLKEEQRNYQIEIEACQIEIDLLHEELDDVKIKLNSFKKSPSHSFV